ncbi:MAG: ParA family protein [Anaerolineae bacterium]|nr:ParA family protein [Anaerolineae bacterium]
MARVIAVASNKGGVAKTTTCLSLGGSLAEAGQLALLIDLDPQAHLTSSLGVEPTTLRRTVCDVLLGQKSIVAASQESAVKNLDIVPANRELVVLDKVLYNRPGYEYRLKASLDQMYHELYDTVLVDCPPSFGALTINALTAADLLIIPVQCEYYAARSLRQMLDMVSRIRQSSNARLSYRVLVTMFDMRNKVHRLILMHLRARFRAALLQTVIQVDTRLRESPAFGMPVTHYAPRTRAAAQYRELARELIADQPIALAIQAPPSGENTVTARKTITSLP